MPSPVTTASRPSRPDRHHWRLETLNTAPLPELTQIASFNTKALLAANIESPGPLIPTSAVGPPGIASLTIRENLDEVGWWRGTVTDGNRTVRHQAPQPGQPSVARVAGHADSAAAGSGALYNLTDRRPDDTLQIVNLKGRTSAGTWP